jgi:hypothetical protein
MESVTPEFILVETLGSHGRVQAHDRVPLTEHKRQVTIGRSPHADVILDDAYAAALHVSVEVAPEGGILATDLGSVNGIGVAGRRIKGARQLPVPNGLLQIGRTRLRVRPSNEALSPERPDHAAIAPVRGSPSWAAGGGGIVCATYVAYSAWLDAPRDVATTIVVAFIPALLVAGAWISLWALLSRVTQGEWRLVWHSAILFSVVAAYVLSVNALDVAWFAFSLPRWELRDVIIGALAFAVAMHWHLTHASSLSRTRSILIAILLPAIVASAGLWVQSRTQERDVNYIGISESIYPPALRLRTAGSAPHYFEQAALLQARADTRRKAISDEDVDDSEEGDESRHAGGHAGR